jgi:hypothetical protein
LPYTGPPLLPLHLLLLRGAVRPIERADPLQPHHNLRGLGAPRENKNAINMDTTRQKHLHGVEILQTSCAR